MAAQQWLGEINQFIFVFYTEYTQTHTRAAKEETKTLAKGKSL